MTEESKLAFMARKSANIIKNLCSMYRIPLKEGTDIYYQSDISELIEDGVADLQCRSDKYLATLVWEEHMESL